MIRKVALIALTCACLGMLMAASVQRIDSVIPEATQLPSGYTGAAAHARDLFP